MQAVAYYELIEYLPSAAHVALVRFERGVDHRDDVAQHERAAHEHAVEGLAVGGRRERANDRVRVKLERIAAARKEVVAHLALRERVAGRLVPLAVVQRRR